MNVFSPTKRKGVKKVFLVVTFLCGEIARLGVKYGKLGHSLMS
mgnify:CR=1 FL=1